MFLITPGLNRSYQGRRNLTAGQKAKKISTSDMKSGLYVYSWVKEIVFTCLRNNQKRRMVRENNSETLSFDDYGQANELHIQQEILQIFE